MKAQWQRACLWITLWMAVRRVAKSLNGMAYVTGPVQRATHPQRRNIVQDQEVMVPMVMDASVRGGEAARARVYRRRCGIEHAMRAKSSRCVCGHGRLGDVATPFPDPRSQRKEAWSRASPEEVPRNRLLARPPLVDVRNRSWKPMPPLTCTATACPGAPECSSSSSPSSSSPSSRL